MKRKLSNRVITYIASCFVAGFLAEQMDDPNEANELRSMWEGKIIPNVPALEWLCLHGRKAYTVLSLIVNSPDATEEDRMKSFDMNTLYYSLRCIENRSTPTHRCFQEFEMYNATDEKLEIWLELDKELEAAGFPQDEE